MKFEASGDQVSGVLAVGVALIEVSIPIAILALVLKKRKRKETKQLMETFEPLYEDLDIKRKSSLLNTFIFTLRRLMLMVTAVLLKNYPSL